MIRLRYYYIETGKSESLTESNDLIPEVTTRFGNHQTLLHPTKLQAHMNPPFELFLTFMVPEHVTLEQGAIAMSSPCSRPERGHSKQAQLKHLNQDTKH